MIKQNQIKKLISAFYKKNYGRVAKDWRPLVNESLDQTKEEERLNFIKNYINLKKNDKILEVGSGFGNFNLFMTKLGYDIIGIEPDSDCLKIAELVSKAEQCRLNIQQGTGEKLPFPNNSFDLVVSFQVIEHVADVTQVLSECNRVLKKNGRVYLAFPNYNSFWEPHYAMIFPTFLGRYLFSWKVRLAGRNTKFLRHLNFIKVGRVEKWLKQKNFNILTTGKEIFVQRFDPNKMPSWGQTKNLTKMVKMVSKIGIGHMLARLLAGLNMHYPANIIAVKTINKR